MSATCKHDHMRFGDAGRTITCIDCPRKWHIQKADGMPDVTYMHPTLSSMDTRHSMFSVPRTKPMPVAKKAEPKLGPTQSQRRITIAPPAVSVVKRKDQHPPQKIVLKPRSQKEE